MKSVEYLLGCYKQHVMFIFSLTTIMSSCNPSKFCISREHTVNFPTSTFSAQTVAASWLRSAYVCSLDTRTYGGRENFPWNTKKLNEEYKINMPWNLPPIFLLGGWEKFLALPKTWTVISDSDDTYPRLDKWTMWSKDTKQFFSNGAHEKQNVRHGVG